MITKKNNIATNSINILLIIIILFPLFTQFFHALEEDHKHTVCTNDSTHLHQSKKECNLCDFNYTPFIYKPLTELVNKNIVAFNTKKTYLYHYLYVSSTINSKKQRGPPIYT